MRRRRAKTAALSCAAIVVGVTGCGTASSSLPRVLATRAPTAHAQPAPLTGARLSALIPTPAGFTLDPAATFNSGAHEATPVPGPADASTIECASWWSGKACAAALPPPQL